MKKLLKNFLPKKFLLRYHYLLAIFGNKYFTKRRLLKFPLPPKETTSTYFEFSY